MFSHYEHCRAHNGLIFLASIAQSTRGHLNFTFCIRVPHGFHNKVIFLQNKTKYSLVGTKRLSLHLLSMQFRDLILKILSDQKVVN